MNVTKTQSKIYEQLALPRGKEGFISEDTSGTCKAGLGVNCFTTGRGSFPGHGGGPASRPLPSRKLLVKDRHVHFTTAPPHSEQPNVQAFPRHMEGDADPINLEFQPASSTQRCLSGRTATGKTYTILGSLDRFIGWLTLLFSYRH